MADRPAAPPKPAPTTPRPPSGPGKTEANARVDARVAAAVALAPPLPDDVRMRLRGLILATRYQPLAVAA